ncbi:MAG: hypothetical protein A2268_12685 [Candidatus Raymondbacteria bacterium RifOxyA12_full_50_37]|uniref:Secretion system C-terminal sorting domain-containing protein n=1 Tax=Candidatus Raymondbacteria bacterium RIFOXYD12_FULL_49_13 TaxID=1817890 RepID=A0A1F7FB43_UNCRA|nr:MAG: hypothetical protein A2268_12685 [Candidatus Raymondbacteria bacterium RifOxyA12_full_50_37]OGJ91032.1 MAG: hypothetical protein A2248_00705 [Candidatus Raymondbacteria bacterium RIFOXYA2_FULL_49_16]OGJ97469.1 MAG: hypothetical protein A2453_10255 [Candidatus Raymondbacteria bacterium RIFOXYC2_FULL_50_21]OGJ99733.1 MAG: hypothetical protein A2350_08960 [Candidatus Raymondbacteria bacterium RifOxyB12_full_50_8]OGK03895.1 MAG: hypothetical protein A2519_00640 [Candidatus Raymondbacteria b
MNKNSLFILCALGLFCTGLHAALSTHSFTDRADRGSHPSTITYGGGQMVFNLSAINGATVYRAIFGPPRNYPSGGSYPTSLHALSKTILISKAGDTLQIMGPRYMTFDMTLAVQQALAAGTRCTLIVASGPGFYSYGGMATLDVMCNLSADSALEQVDSALARFKDGDAMITFKEVDPPFTTTAVTMSEFTTYTNAHNPEDRLGDVQKIRYRIYRSTQPLTSENALATADLIDEIAPLSCWDSRYFGQDGAAIYPSNIVPQYPVDDLVIASPGTGIYMDRYKGSGSETLYYFVSHCVDGAEDFSSLIQNGNATGSVAATPGPECGWIIKREVRTDVTFAYVAHTTLNYYVRWECPPYYRTPSHAMDYLIAVPPNAPVNPHAMVGLHCWSGTVNTGWINWNDGANGQILISTNDEPYDWWTASHENMGTFKPYTEGTVQPYTEARILSFLFDFAVPTFSINTDRIMTQGGSMGGSGASLWGIRSGHIFSNIAGLVGVHIPSKSPTYANSFAGSYGDSSWHCIYSNAALERFGYPVIHPSDNVSVWDYWDNTKWLASNPTVETPWETFTNGVLDGGIGWPQAWEYTKALISHKRGFNFHWGQGGHSQGMGGFANGNQFKKSQSYPAFTNGSLDQSLGNAPGEEDLEGDINLYVMWNLATVVDEPSQWEMTMWLNSSAPQTTETIDITPRRLQQLMHGAGSTYTWEFVEGVTPVASGNATADVNGLITITGLSLSKTQRTLKINCDNCTAGTGAMTGTGDKTGIIAYPNPFNPVVTISSKNPAASSKKIEIKIYNTQGKIVQKLSTGSLLLSTGISWDASDQPSGIYIIRATVGNSTMLKKISLIK